MARWYEAANEASFKQVAEGTVFQCPNPWVFARPRYYLLNQAQKTEVSAIMGRWRLLLLASLAIVMVIPFSFITFVHLAPAAFVRLIGPLLHFGIGSTAALVAVILVLVETPIVAAPQLYLNRRLRTALVDAPRTNQRITMSEQLPKAAASVSGVVLAVGLVCAIGMIGSGILGLVDPYLEGHLARALLFPFLPLVSFGGLLTAYFAYLLRLKAKLKRATATLAAQ